MAKGILFALALAIFGGAAFLWWENQQKSDLALRPAEQTDSRGQPQVGRQETGSNPVAVNSMPRDPEQAIVWEHLAAMDGFGPEAESQYQKLLADLRKNPAQAVQRLSDLYEKLTEGSYGERWKVVHTLATIGDEAAMTALRSIASAPVPPEKSPNSDGIGTSGEERAIRATAIDGLASLARDGNREAEATLLQLALETGSLSLQRRAVRGYLAAGDNFEEREKTLRAQLNPTLHSLISLEVSSPEVAELSLEKEPAPPTIDAFGKSLSLLLAWIESATLASAWADECYTPITEGKNGEAYVDIPAIYEARYSSSSWCSKPKIYKMWKDFKLQDKDWIGPAGLGEPCNLKYPLGRTFNTLWFLLTSVPDPAWELEDRRGSLLRWGYNYAASVSSHLRLVCDGTVQRALAFYHTPTGTMNVTWSWAMGNDIINRSATIIHEARHHKKLHGPADCGRGMSCDPDWAYSGANAFEVMWYWHFHRSAVNTTTAHKDRAKVLGQMVLDEAFNTPPGFTIY